MFPSQLKWEAGRYRWCTGSKALCLLQKSVCAKEHFYGKLVLSSQSLLSQSIYLSLSCVHTRILQSNLTFPNKDCLYHRKQSLDLPTNVDEKICGKAIPFWLLKTSYIFQLEWQKYKLSLKKIMLTWNKNVSKRTLLATLESSVSSWQLSSHFY